MTELQVIARYTIHDGKLGEFKKAAAESVRLVRENESGCSQYGWFFNKDKTECVVIETYTDTEAVLAHLQNVGECIGILTSIAELSLEVYGSPGDELRAGAEQMGARFYSHFESI